MTRRHVTFACAGERLVGTLDEGSANAGLLIVSGGNEIRSGAFGGQARLARALAAQGFPVFRFDRRGVGDSSGENLGFRESRPDILAAIAVFREHCPQVQRLVAFGNCDAASALMLLRGEQCDALVLANPWTFEDDDSGDLPPAAVRARYAEKLLDPAEWLRLLRGGVSLRKLGAGLRTAVQPAPPSDLLQDLRAGLAGFKGEVRFLVAGSDRTGLAFRSAWGQDDRIALRDKADHAFSAADDSEWLERQLAAALHEQAREFDVG